MMPAWLAIWHVFLKEVTDALRDRKTLMTVLFSAVAMGPLMLVLVSTLVSDQERHAAERTVAVENIKRAPSFENYLLRQGIRVKAAPDNFERQLRDNELGDAVIVVADDFESSLAQGYVGRLTLVWSSSNQRAQASTGLATAAVDGFTREVGTLRLANRGVAPALLQVVDLEHRDVASTKSRASQVSVMLPFFVLMAVVYGALNAALDTTAGERERGSLEALLMTPASRMSLVMGKWAAVAAVGMLIAFLSTLSFLPGRWLLRSESLSAAFSYGLPQAVAFLAILLPLACALAAALMAVAIRCDTVKQAQASSAVVVMGMSLMPLVSLMNQGGAKAWHLWVPALAQNTLMGRVIKGEALAPLDYLVPALVCTLATALCLLYVGREVAGLAKK